jgi:hydrogenase-4 membrane subunit HyfE
LFYVLQSYLSDPDPILNGYVTPSLLLLFLLLVLWVLDRAVVRKKFDLILSRPFLPLAILVISAIIFGGPKCWFAFVRQAPLNYSW